MKFRFKKENKDVEKRRKLCEKLRAEYPDKIPVICEKDPYYWNLKEIQKTRYLIPNDLKLSTFHYHLRQLFKIDEYQSFFLLANGKTFLMDDDNFKDIYEKYKDKKDGFLYIAYGQELVWGNN